MPTLIVFQAFEFGAISIPRRGLSLNTCIIFVPFEDRIVTAGIRNVSIWSCLCHSERLDPPRSAHTKVVIIFIQWFYEEVQPVGSCVSCCSFDISLNTLDYGFQ